MVEGTTNTPGFRQLQALRGTAIEPTRQKMCVSRKTEAHALVSARTPVFPNIRKVGEAPEVEITFFASPLA